MTDDVQFGFDPQDIYLPLYYDEDDFIFLITGGRGSGKSTNVSAFISRLTFEMEEHEYKRIAHQILYTRYTMVSADMSIIPEFREKIELDGTGDFFTSTKTDVVNNVTGSRVMFRGIRTSSGNQTAKLKSIYGLTVFVCDEAEEWTSEQDFEKIMLSIRQKGIRNIIIIIMNPTDNNHWVYKRFLEKTHKIVYYEGVPVQISTYPNLCHIHTTYLDNLPNLSAEFLRNAEECKLKNPEKYAHVYMGRWSDIAEGAVFKTIHECKTIPEWVDKLAIGLDFGYTTDPTAAVMCGVSGNDLYMKQLIYKTGMTSADLIEALYPYRDLNIYADNADPRLIDELHLAGLNIYPVKKGPNSIKAGIDKMKTMNMFVTSDSYDMQYEFRKYTWAKDKDGNYINKPIDAYNHCIDAVRYYVYSRILGHVKI